MPNMPNMPKCSKTRSTKGALEKKKKPEVWSYSKPKLRTVSKRDLEEYQLARQQAKQLTRVREFLVQHEADEEMIYAIDQALEDNEFWYDRDLDFNGSA
jgi:hypothetical protein